MEENNIIGISNLPNLLHNDYSFRGCNFNIMVVGSNGLGKTTFLNRLFDTKMIKNQPFDVSGDNPYWVMESKCNIQTSSFEIRENGFTTRINITEIDGLGDCVDNRDCYKPIIEILEKNFQDYQEKFKVRTKSTIDDKRIHVCLYFLEPISYIKRPDLETLKQISAHCTIVPIVAKSDLISSDEVLNFKYNIKNILEQNEISFFDDIENSAEGPFMIFSEFRNSESNNKNEFVTPGYNTQTNDFTTVKRLIIETRAIDLINLTDQYYDNFRISRLILNSTDRDIIENKERIEKKIKKYKEYIKRMSLKEKETVSNTEAEVK